MAKYYGKIGFAESVEIRPGVWNEKIVARPYFGDTIRNSRLLQNSGNVNDDINVAIQISIVADPYAKNNYFSIRYVEYMNSRWKVTTVEEQYPRLLLTLGGLWNGQKT